MDNTVLDSTIKTPKSMKEAVDVELQIKPTCVEQLKQYGVLFRTDTVYDMARIGQFRDKYLKKVVKILREAIEADHDGEVVSCMRAPELPKGVEAEIIKSFGELENIREIRIYCIPEDRWLARYDVIA